MKQLFVCDAIDNSGDPIYELTDGLKANGALTFAVKNPSGVLISLDDAYTAYDGIMTAYLGRGADLQPRCIPDIDIKSLKTTKSAYLGATMAGEHFDATITPDITNVVEGDIYTLILSKVGTPFNERGNWTFDYVVPSDNITVEDIRNYFADAIQKNTNLNIKVVNDDQGFELDATDWTDWVITGANDWKGTIDINGTGSEPIQDTAWLKKLARECAENKGFEYLAEDGKELYPGYLQDIPAGKTFTMFTLRWATPRVSSKTRDEVVSQLLHIAVDSTKTSVITKLNGLLGFD